jgi:propionate CoA-transferase
MMRVKFLTAKEAMDTVTDGSTIVTDGFAGSGFAEDLAVALEDRFLKTGRPRGLSFVFCGGQGDFKDKGLNHFAHEGLTRRLIGGHFGLAPKLQQMAVENKLEAYNICLGVLSQLFRDIAAKRPGHITHVGLNTIMDPRLQGGRLNAAARDEMIELITIHGKEYLLYKAFHLDCAFLRGTYADENGNVSMDKETVTTEVLSVAQAVRNCGGRVFVQVERVVKNGELNPKLVKIPGIYVDTVVVAAPKNHMQTFNNAYNPAYSGEKRVALEKLPPMPLSDKKIICRRAAMELKGGGNITNLGIGTPEGVASVAAEEGIADKLLLTVESGPIGGVPAGGVDFGCSTNPEAIIDEPNQFDFYQGGGADITFLGLAEADPKGNVNASKFGSKIPGSGGFIDISQNAKKVVFCGTFTASGLKVEIQNGCLNILTEGSIRKFKETLEHITFSAKNAVETGQPVLYITERAVFSLDGDGLVLTEVAPGIDLERDILDQMAFKPQIHKDLKLMDERLFRPEKMGLA